MNLHQSSRFFLPGLLLTLISLTAAPASAQIPASFSQKLMVPAYFRPGDVNDGWSGNAWSELSASPEVGIVIFNPYNGPGAPSQVSVYSSAIQSARAAGKKVIGYVYSSWAGRDFNALKSDIDNFYSWYVDSSGQPLVDGIFVDQVAVTAPEADPSAWLSEYVYYYQVRDAIKAHGAGQVVVLNPGMVADHTITDLGDIILSYDGVATGFDSWSPPLLAAGRGAGAQRGGGLRGRHRRWSRPGGQAGQEPQYRLGLRDPGHRG